MEPIKEIEFQVDDFHSVEIQVGVDRFSCAVCGGSGLSCLKMKEISGYNNNHLLYSICRECLNREFDKI